MVMCSITAVLLVIAGDQASRPNPSWLYDMQPDMRPPAAVMARLINGPGLGIGYGPIVKIWHLHIFGPVRLLLVLLFWYLVGTALEKRLLRQHLIERGLLRIILYSLGFLCSMLAVWNSCNVLAPMISYMKKMIEAHGLWASGINTLLVLFWAVGFALYFGNKLWNSRPVLASVGRKNR